MGEPSASVLSQGRPATRRGPLQHGTEPGPDLTRRGRDQEGGWEWAGAALALILPKEENVTTLLYSRGVLGVKARLMQPN